uniref:hypothetical protein n=1 Tax=Ningiella ruwaisensis TaxID=2364274 RepID=UPI00109EE6FF|nr:hypothetical protein [Ningiella ruwaisensis]
MLVKNVSKPILTSGMSLIAICLLSGCALIVDSDDGDARLSVPCATIEDGDVESKCTTAKAIEAANRRDAHEEFTQQTLPIHEREDIINQEIHDRSQNH